MTTERLPPTGSPRGLLTRMRTFRLIWIGILLAGLVAAGLRAIRPATWTSDSDTSPTVAPTPPPGAAALSGDDSAGPFFARHCQSCHTGPKPKGDFRLDSLAMDFNDGANQ